MKKSIVLCCLISHLLIVPTFGQIDMNQKNEDVVVNYLGQFKFNNMHCSFIINELLFGASVLQLNDGWEPENISWSDEIGALLIEGKNTIEMEGFQIPQQTRDGSDSYCEMTITAMAENRMTGEESSKEVFDLRISYDAEGKFTVADSRKYPELSVSDIPTLRFLESKAYDVDWVNNDVMAERHLQINHSHNTYSWTKAKPFQNTPENQARLWDAYAEIEKALEKRDEKKLEAIFSLASQETDHYIGEGSHRWNAILEMFRQNWKTYGYEPVAIDKNDYELEIANHGKIFRFVRKDSFAFPPILYKNSIDNDTAQYRFYFTEIDGKIVPAIL